MMKPAWKYKHIVVRHYTYYSYSISQQFPCSRLLKFIHTFSCNFTNALRPLTNSVFLWKCPLSHCYFVLHYFIWLSHDILLCHIIIEQFTSVEQHIGGLLAAVPPLVNACEEFLTISHDINNK